MSLFGTYIEESNKRDNKSIADSLSSFICITMTHMLKYKYQPEKQTRSWINSIYKFINELEDDSRKSRSNKQYTDYVVSLVDTDSNFDKIYNTAINKASDQTGIPRYKFDNKRPEDWTYDNLSDRSFIKDFIMDKAYSYEIKQYLGI